MVIWRGWETEKSGLACQQRNMPNPLVLPLFRGLVGFMTNNSFFAFALISDCQGGGIACITRAFE
jgi:hypothetical protein